MKKIKEIHHKHSSDHLYEDGEIGAIGSVASASAAAGAAIGVAVAALPGLLIGAAIGGAVGAIGSIVAVEEMDPPPLVPPKKNG